MLLIPKTISNISNNYDSSESFVSPRNESLANKQIQHFPTSFNYAVQVRQQGQRNLSEVNDTPSGLRGANQSYTQP